jgi:hypothetical protein
MTHDEFCSEVDKAIERISDRLHTTGALLTIIRGEVPKDAALSWLLAHGADLSACAAMLKSKNRAYGNSALDPVHIFSHLDERAGLLVRIDDKLSRLARGSDAGEDTRADLLGYLVMLEIADARRAAPLWVVPFIDRPGHYAHANGQTVGPKPTAQEAVELLSSALGWGGGERHAYQAYEVPNA